ncbi:MAG: KH domain-containing protein [Pseudobdellovibrionaceae bacterium]
MGEKKLNENGPQVVARKPTTTDNKVPTFDLETFQKTMQSTLTQICSLLVNHPSELKIRIEQGPRTTVFHIECNASDRGQIIGKQGRIAASLRTILESVSARAQVRAVINIVE